MQQIIPDIDPWKFRAFTPDECTKEVLDALPFNKFSIISNVKDGYSYPRGTTSSVLPDDIAKFIIDSARMYGKEDLFLELSCGVMSLNIYELLLATDKRTIACVFDTTIPKELITLDRAHIDQIVFWQWYAQSHNDIITKHFLVNLNKGLKVRVFAPLVQPKVYYDINTNMIYNRLLPIKAGDYAFIPIFVSSICGGIIIQATADCVIPLGVGRCRTQEQAREWHYSHQDAGVIHNETIIGSYGNYSYAEFNDKSVLDTVLSKLPIKIIHEFGTYRI